MEITLVIIAFIFLLTGLIGSIIPAIPGLPLGYAGLLFIQWSGYGNFSFTFLLILAGCIIIVTIMDNFLPALMTKRFGGSRLAVIGSVTGLIIGMIFFAPAGLLLGPFLGALAGELINNKIRSNRKNDDQNSSNTNSNSNMSALKVAFGNFLAFILGTGAKMILGTLMIYYAVRAVFFSAAGGM